ncbi:hypothetical protein THASP1DRAFT_31770 [Thamnocephalis sphaerospora]|uniref:Uncharacterized protein n=1 Tax=Thamnocephalis sphaerospora TaxID=78915 RepID=A0A4P9XMD0_9FUNG|nr:hypothetical protein THASP1DRAFT_31770 [Thamnocephalis sphaerospora]|eukprot:RKP06410.1 hypothetical protein THASP1DRAFT_31770 [Thamnocephalis sphaerospora]
MFVRSHMSDNDPKVLEREKWRLLNGRLQDIKADQTKNKSFSEMQHDSVEALFLEELELEEEVTTGAIGRQWDEALASESEANVG